MEVTVLKIKDRKVDKPLFTEKIKSTPVEVKVPKVQIKENEVVVERPVIKVV